MKRLILLVLYSFISHALLANGVVFNKAEIKSYLTLEESSIYTVIENQVSNTVTTQIFKNEIEDSLEIKYAFPIPENASATKLRYKLYGKWYTANFAPVPQDTTTGGSPGEEDLNLKQYLGSNPLYFDINQKINKDSTILIELTYVELLTYKFGKVKYLYPNNYQLIQTDILSKQEINITLKSARTINNIELLSHSAITISNNGNQAIVNYIEHESVANADYLIQYSLSLDELGLFSLSTYLPDSLQKDPYGRGFFSFIVEPDPSENSEVIDKVFTLIIDRSGSMSGNKIVQARDAAKFIIENLNEGDRFNIISFATEITSFRSGHIEFNTSNKDLALNYINSLEADGATNISGAFDKCVPQFEFADPNTANIIIFLTDGEQTAGIENTDDLISHIDNLFKMSEKQITLFTFGIGDYTNERLLTTIANNNNGISEYLKNDELEEVITDFYLLIRNPVLLNTEIDFSPSIIDEIYPVILPNLYKGQQMILVGRYNESANVTTTLTGNAYNDEVEYQYLINLSDSFNVELQFLSKLWAQGKINHLMDQYYLNLDDSNISESIKNEIISLSLDYGVISPFTSFQGNDFDNNPTNLEWEVTHDDEARSEDLSNEYLQIESIYPNPCHSYLNIKINSKLNVNGLLTLKVVNTQGQEVYSVNEFINSLSNYQFEIDIEELQVNDGLYLLLVQYNNKTIAFKFIIN